ncbi:11078_t:CDS:1, partial [Acaulospora colombiana]
ETWPSLDLPPPIMPEFNALVNFDKIPPAPVRPNVSACPTTNTYCNWYCTGCLNEDITNCPNPG